jgi:hypothetical protein
VSGDDRSDRCIVVALKEELKDNAYSPSSARLEINREAVVGELAARPVIHDDHGLLSYRDHLFRYLGMIPALLTRVPETWKLVVISTGHLPRTTGYAVPPDKMM